VGSPTDTNEQLFRGCLSGSKDNYMLADQQTGQSYRLHSDKDINEHVGDLVEVRGTIKKEGSDQASGVATGGMQEIDVADIKTVSKGCSASQGASNMGTEQSSQSASATGTEQQPATSTESSAAATAAPSTSAESQSTAPSTSSESAATSTQSQSATTPSAPAETAQNQESGQQLPQSDQPQTQQPSEQQPPSSATGTTPSGNEQTVRGCISGTKDNLMISDQQTGQSFHLVSSQDLSAHIGHEVEVRGSVQANPNVSAGGTQDLQVTDVKMISDSCAAGPGAASNMGNEQSTQSATATGTEQQPASSTAGAAPSTSAESQTTAPSTSAESQTTAPSTSAESQATAPSASAESQTTAPSTSAESQATAPSASTESAATQTENQPVAGNEAAPESAQAAPSGAESANAQNPNAAQGGQLPQTGSELPLLLLMGFGSLGAGLLSRFRR
jgi:LPXTG-motif cell wall-anchored protein